MRRYRLVFSIIVVTHAATHCPPPPATFCFFVTRLTPLHDAYTNHTTLS
jgi:hypothetical protein